MSDTVKIATTMTPWKEQEVSRQEATDLLRRGFVAKLDGRKVGDADKAANKLKDNGQPTG